MHNEDLMYTILHSSIIIADMCKRISDKWYNVCVHVLKIVGHCLDTKVLFIGKLPVTRGLRVIIRKINNERSHGPT